MLRRLRRVGGGNCGCCCCSCCFGHERRPILNAVYAGESTLRLLHNRLFGFTVTADVGSFPPRSPHDMTGCIYLNAVSQNPCQRPRQLQNFPARNIKANGKSAPIKDRAAERRTEIRLPRPAQYTSKAETSKVSRMYDATLECHVYSCSCSSCATAFDLRSVLCINCAFS